MSIDLGGLWLGPEDGARARYLFTRRQRAYELAAFARAYAPFRQVDGDGELVFRGRGADAPGAAERRMIAEWTRHVVVEAGGDPQGEPSGEGRMSTLDVRRPAWPRGAAPAGLPGGPPIYGGRAADLPGSPPIYPEGAAYSPVRDGRPTREELPIYPGSAADGGRSPFGLAFAWHRGAATGGVCDELTVYLSGEVRAGSCGTGTQVEGRLGRERLERLYAWVDGLEPFQAAGEQEVRADALIERLVFAGSGRRRASPGDIAAIDSFAASLHRELLTAAAPASRSAAGVAAASTSRPRPPDAASAAAGEAGAARAAAPAVPEVLPSRELPAGPAETGAEESSTDLESPTAPAASTAPTATAPPNPSSGPAEPPTPRRSKDQRNSAAEPTAPPPPSPPPPSPGGGR